ncbi:hypothetical protein AGIG_G18908 [Arapaima gigas]
MTSGTCTFHSGTDVTPSGARQFTRRNVSKTHGCESLPIFRDRERQVKVVRAERRGVSKPPFERRRLERVARGSQLRPKVPDAPPPSRGEPCKVRLEPSAERGAVGPSPGQTWSYRRSLHR